MNAIRDAREMPAERRMALVERIRAAEDARVPELSWWNCEPCGVHAPEPDSLCDECGLVLRSHQRTGALLLWLAERQLLADDTGSGKTAILAFVLALCKASGELGEHNRAVIVCPASAVPQWGRQLRRLLPEIPSIAVTGSSSRAKRVEAYMSAWEIAVVSDRSFAAARGREGDVALLSQFPVGIVIADDTDALRTHRTQTAKALKRVAGNATRVYDTNATPLQKRPMELHSHLEFLGLTEVFGSPTSYRRHFVKTGTDAFYQRAMSCRTPVPCPIHQATGVIPGCKRCKVGHTWPQPARRCPVCGGHGQVDPTGRTVLRTVSTDLGLRNVEELRYLLRPWLTRRRDFGGPGYPAVQPSVVWVDLNPGQRARYDELRRTKEVRRFLEAGEEVSRVKAAALFTRGAQICSGTAALDEGQTDDSAKLDRLMRMITGELIEEKVVAFVYFKPNVAALSARLEAAGVGHVLMWSNETDATVRDERVHRFTHDPDCRVIVGTTTLARSLNLQRARHLVAVDTVLNPALMAQIAGRVKRLGSAYRTVFFHQMFARGTQEEGYLPLLQREQGMADAVFGERGELFGGLSPGDMLRLVAGETGARR